MRARHWAAVAGLLLLAGPAWAAIAINQAPLLNVAPHQVTIWWRTDVSGTTAVHFGPASQATWSAYPNASVFAAQAGTLHSRTLPHLPPGTYYYRVRSVDGGGAWTQSAEGSFLVPPADQNTPLGQLVTAGSVSALQQVGDTLLLGGGFKRVGVRKGSGLVTDATSGAVLADQPQVAGVVRVAVSDGAGGFYIGGDFGVAGGLSRGRLARILPDGGIDPVWNPNVNGTVSALVVSGSTVYLAGSFTTVGGTTRNSVAAVDAASGALLPWNPNANGAVLAAAVSGSTVYLAGSFTTVGGVARSRLAAVDAASGALLAWNPGASASVFALAVSGSTIFLGGIFSSVAGTARPYAAAVDAAGVLLPWSPSPNSNVRALALSGSAVYLGGDFNNVGGTARSAAAAVDPATGGLLAWNPDVEGLVFSLAVSGASVYVGGFISRVGGSARDHAAAVDATTGALLPWNPEAGGIVDTVATSGSTVYLGGRFTTAGGTARNGLAAIDVASGALLPWNPGANASVSALAVLGSTVYVGGTFSTVGGTARANLAALDLTSGALLPWNPSPNGAVSALAVSGSTVFLAGAFSSVGGTARSGVAALDATTGAVLPFDPSAGSYVTALAVLGSTVYLAGNFNAVGGTSRLGVAAVDAATGALLPWIPGQNTIVSSLAVSGDVVYLGGPFTLVGSAMRSNQAAVHATTGALLSWNAFPNGFSTVAVGAAGSFVLVGGNFTTLQGLTARSRIAALDTSAQILPFNPGSDAGPSTFAFSGTGSGVRVHVAGAFTALGGVSQGGFASFLLPPLEPAVLTAAATSVTTVSATLNGSAAPNGTSTTGHFRYSASDPGSCNDAFGIRAPASGETALGTGPAFQAYSEGITGLTSGTTYYACAIATSSLGTRFGLVRSFTTPSAPAVTTEAATSVTGAGATLNGTATPNGESTTAHFRYSTSDPGSCDDAFGARAPATGGASLGSGATAQAYSQVLTGLSPLTTYYYCAIASNSLGTRFGAVRFFATPDAPTVTTAAATGVTGVVATLNGLATPNGASTTGWFRYATSAPASCDDSFGIRAPSAGGSPLGSGTTAQAFSQGLTGLAPGTTYSFCAIGWNVAGTRFGQALSFTTASAPTVTTTAATSVTGTTATLNGTAVPNGDSTTGHFRYVSSVIASCNDSFGTRVPFTGGSTLGSGAGAQGYSEALTGLTPGTTYSFCAIATNSAGTRFGAVLTFTTPGAPSVTTTAATAVTGTSATLNGSANPNRDATTGHFRYDTTSPGSCNDLFGARVPATGGSSLGNGSTSLAYSEDLTGLSPGTTYYFCAIATNSLGTRYGALLSFTTASAPTVTTTAATGVTGTSATLNGSAIPNRDATTGYFRYAATDPGSCDDSFGTRAPSTGGSALGSGTTAQAFSRGLAGLTEGTTYYYCAIANNSEGTRFGVMRSFTTLNVPTVTTGAASDVTGVTATLNGSANPNGLSTTGYFRYATAHPGSCNGTFGTRAPASGGSALGSGTSAQAFSQGIVGLTPGLTYYFCAIATNSGGTSFGAVLSFALGAPTVTTQPATVVTGTTATLNALATPNGAPASGHFRYATTNPGSCDDLFGTRAPAVGGTSLGSGFDNPPYSQDLTGLVPGATYYFCAIASSSVGIGVGVVVSFTTPTAAAAPTTITLAASSVTSTSATLNGSASPNGASASGHFRYATADPGSCDDTFGTRAPAVGGSALGSGGVAQTYSEGLTGLLPGATYYYCAIATNAEGSGLGAVLSFTAPPAAAEPDSVLVAPASATAPVGVRLAGTIQVVTAQGDSVAGSRIVTVAVTGSATLCSSSLVNAEPLGQASLSGEASASGSATFEVCNAVEESVTVTATFAGQPGTSAPATWEWTGACGSDPGLTIVGDAATSAEVGSAYAYNATGRVGVTGASGSVRYSICDTAPPELAVDAATGSVQWTPTAAGEVELCLRVEDACGQQTYSFRVLVSGRTAAGGCGCTGSAGGLAGWVAGLGLLALWRRRRRDAGRPGMGIIFGIH